MTWTSGEPREASGGEDLKLGGLSKTSNSEDLLETSNSGGLLRTWNSGVYWRLQTRELTKDMKLGGLLKTWNSEGY